MKRILIATDGSDGARAAVEEGVALASETAASVTFVTVRNQVGGLFADPLYQRHLTHRLAHARAALVPAEAEAERAGVGCESEILEGDPVDCIVEAARTWDADLVVVGSRGHGAVTSAVIGSVSREVVRRSPAPVMVVRQTSRTGAAA
ncbi:MAG: universal stress protein [Verrucomicrobiota bacterium]